MILRFGGSSGFVVFYRTVDAVESLSLETSVFRALFASGLFRQILDVRARRRQNFKGSLNSEYARQIACFHG